MDWKELNPKSKRPKIADVESYLNNESRKLFREFIDFLSTKLGLTYVKPVYLKLNGWSFEIGRSGLIMIKGITFTNQMFYVETTEVKDKDILNKILLWAVDLYNKEFSDELKGFSANRVEEQRRRDIKRKQREKAYIDSIQDEIDQPKFNIYRWSPPISRNKLQLLYEGDAKGMLDSELLEDIGCTIYARCIQSHEERVLMDVGKMKCHNCGNILKDNSGLITCSCGFQYIFKEYRRSFRASNMPTGGAAHIFKEFTSKWEHIRGDSEKMRLIDWLIHEFHINLLSGAKGRFVGVNLIQGSKSHVKELITKLAYGGAGIASEKYRRYFENNM